MYDPHRYPQNIITNYLVITGMAVWHQEDFVLLMGFYGNPADAMQDNYIEIECTFDQLNTLLMELSQGSEFYRDYAARAEVVMDRVAEVLTHPTDDQDIIDLLPEDPLYFFEHVFSLALVHEIGEDGKYTVPEEPSYVFRGYARRATGWPVQEDAWGAANKEEQAAFLARLLVLRYGLFLAFNGKVRRSEALIIADLTDPQLFALARAQYELLEEAVKENPGEYE